MHDAIALANLIYALPSNNTKDITQSFNEYQAERLPPAIDAYKSSATLSKFTKGGITGALAFFISKHMPEWLWRIFVAKMVANRPQVGFLASVEDKGTLPPNVSPSTEKARELYEERMKAVSV